MSTASNSDRPESLTDEEIATADSGNPLIPSGRWLGRQFVDSHIHPSFQSAVFPAEVSDQRCIELAEKNSLYMDDFIELIGIGGGSYGSYLVGEGGVRFRQWDAEHMNQAPVDWQMEMRRDNRTAPQLSFPCSSDELLQFVDTAIGLHRFIAPEAFRQATLGSARHEKYAASAPPVTPIMKVAPSAQIANSVPSHITTHSTKERRYELDDVIDKAARETGSLNTSSVWVCLTEWASSVEPPSPLVGFIDEGIQYKGKHFQSDGSYDILTKHKLDSRMFRRRKKTNNQPFAKPR